MLGQQVIGVVVVNASHMTKRMKLTPWLTNLKKITLVVFCDNVSSGVPCRPAAEHIPHNKITDCVSAEPNLERMSSNAPRKKGNIDGNKRADSEVFPTRHRLPSVVARILRANCNRSRNCASTNTTQNGFIKRAICNVC